MSRHARQNGVSCAVGHVVVQHDEVADVLDLRARLLVELVDVGLAGCRRAGTSASGG